MAEPATANLKGSARELAWLRTPGAIRERTQRLMDRARGGEGHFAVDETRLDEVAEFVTRVTRENYPNLAIPFHSRWGHFNAGGHDRLADLNTSLDGQEPQERARVKLDLVIVSVLLDAGAGPNWSYRDPDTGGTIARSEGLAVASYHMFRDGAFGTDGERSFTKADVLLDLDQAQLEAGFQVGPDNPLAGCAGRLALLRELGAAMAAQPELFGNGRPGNLLDALIRRHGDSCSAEDVLAIVLEGLGPIWPGRISLNGINLGDVWHHPALGDAQSATGLVPFHKLSQWLTYSMIEPIREAGIQVDGVERLTGLAEYRNGGLMLDGGLLALRDPELANLSHPPSSELIVEWRALTVVLLDAIAVRVRENLGFDEETFPLAKALEGGTWWAGRRLAAQRRADGGPPLRLASDGTVF
ncbi:URC4/urg3 family protein [Sulfidibacter corallicola]|uniref:URC4/urg3 family protein n=1 Tax=Sulfidibacter corallicola TaxID=2818388 RepID=A0A8A4TPL3_SULCO|nr:URC4/urg3 family protein [Sulfidibacter corallicola]QTD51490.1 URC4/urg3 family protein [Sulfidibacter corallicola]